MSSVLFSDLPSWIVEKPWLWRPVRPGLEWGDVAAGMIVQQEASYLTVPFDIVDVTQISAKPPGLYPLEQAEVDAGEVWEGGGLVCARRGRGLAAYPKTDGGQVGLGDAVEVLRRFAHLAGCGDGVKELLRVDVVVPLPLFSVDTGPLFEVFNAARFGA